jgi:C1A family cysteine protease
VASGVDWYVADMAEVPLAHDGVEDEVEGALAVGFPVALIVELTEEFEDPDEHGEIAVPAITSPLGDYHAVVAVGAETTADGTTRRLLVRNSWGSGWGAGGYGWLPLEYLTAFAVEAAVLDPRTMLTY